MKAILKEICIMVLLCIAVILIFAIVFYDFIPNEVIPNKVAYTVPEDVAAELKEDINTDEEKPQQITYSVTTSDLKQYESATVYQPGNPNPFQAYATGNNNNVIIGGGTTGSTGNGNSTSSNGIQYYYQNSSGLK